MHNQQSDVAKSMAFTFKAGTEVSFDLKKRMLRNSKYFKSVYISDLLLDPICNVEFNVSVWFCVLV